MDSVDDLKMGRGAEYVDLTAVFVVYVSSTYGYFKSADMRIEVLLTLLNACTLSAAFAHICRSISCLRELLRAVILQKPITLLVGEPEGSHGGVSRDEIWRRLEQACQSLDEWGLADEVAAWGRDSPPTPVEIFDAIFARPPIEFSRLGPFQLVTLRMLADKTNCGGGGAGRLVRDGRV